MRSVSATKGTWNIGFPGFAQPNAGQAGKLMLRDGMQTIFVRRADELGSAARTAVEGLLGRKVADEEHVTVMAYRAGGAAGEPDHKAAVQDLIEDLDSMAAKASHIPPAEMEVLIDEATRHVRNRPR